MPKKPCYNQCVGLYCKKEGIQCCRLVRSQVNYYGETNALYTHMTNTSSVSAHPGVENLSEDPPPLNQHQIVSDKEYSDDINKHLAAIKGLSIVGM